MSRSMNMTKLEFEYRKLSGEQKLELVEGLRGRLEGASKVVFAYVYGSFVERSSFRDLDVAIWIRDPGEAFYHTVDFSAKLEVEMGGPVDVQVLNEEPYLPFHKLNYLKHSAIPDSHSQLQPHQTLVCSNPPFF